MKNKAERFWIVPFLTPCALRELLQGMNTQPLDRSRGKQRRNAPIRSGLVGFIPLDDWMKRDTV